jgi:hypothetical protein
VEPLTATAAAALVVRYVLPAVKTLGEKVWEKSEAAASDQAADAAVSFGRRLLHRLLPHHPDGEPMAPEVVVREKDVAKRVNDLVARPDDAKVATLVEGAVESLLDTDPGLLAAIAELLAAAPRNAVQQGDRSVSVGRDNSGVIVAGDGNTVQR